MILCNVKFHSGLHIKLFNSLVVLEMFLKQNRKSANVLLLLFINQYFWILVEGHQSKLPMKFHWIWPISWDII